MVLYRPQGVNSKVEGRDSSPRSGSGLQCFSRCQLLFEYRLATGLILRIYFTIPLLCILLFKINMNFRNQLKIFETLCIYVCIKEWICAIYLCTTKNPLSVFDYFFPALRNGLVNQVPQITLLRIFIINLYFVNYLLISIVSIFFVINGSTINATDIAQLT